jgi:rubrerythrin
MPEFGNPFAGLAAGRKVSHQELVRAVRFMIAAEYEAVQLYMQLAESTDHELARVVLEDIANEERVHAGEFLALLRQLAPDEEGFYQEGSREVEEMMETMQPQVTIEEPGRAGTGSAEGRSPVPLATVGDLSGMTPG